MCVCVCVRACVRVCVRACVRVCVGRGAGGMGITLVLLAGNLTLNSDAAPNYKYMFGPNRGPKALLHL